MENINTSVNIAGITLKNPVIAASGTFGYGSEYASFIDVEKLGGICSKGITLEPRFGNAGVRLVETKSGLINSIGLENPGIEHFIANELSQMRAFKGVAIIVNLSGSSVQSYVDGAKLLNDADIDMVELNISCPNVKAGGMAFGMDPCVAANVVDEVKRVLSKKPVMVKLSPNAPDLVGVANAVREAGADALSLVNTFSAMAINIDTGKPVFNNITAGFSGPAIKPIALRMVWQVAKSMQVLPEEKRIPIVGLGGISCWQDAVEFIMAGASAIQVGTNTFANPYTMEEIVNGIQSFMNAKHFTKLEDFRGSAL